MTAKKSKHLVTWLTGFAMVGGVAALQAEAASVPAPTVTAEPTVVKVKVVKKAAPTKITKTTSVSPKQSNTNHATSGGSK